MNEEQKPIEPEVVDKVPDTRNISQAEQGATGEGYAHHLQVQAPLDPKDAIKRMRAYTELVKVRAEEIQKRRVLACSMTTKHHWNNIEGSPYLNKGGARMLQRTFRVAVRDRVHKETWHEDELGRFVQHEYEAIFDAGGEYDCVYALGTRNQRSRFFAKKKETVKDAQGNVVMEERNGKKYPKRESVWRDLSEIDPGNIKKSAWTNCLVNGMQGLLALDGITWEELSEMTGGRVNEGSVQQVSMGQRGSSGRMGPASDGQVRMLFAKCYNAGKGCLEALCKHLGIPKLREGTKDSPGEIHVQSNQVNEAVKFIESWGSSEAVADNAEGKMTRDQVDRLNKGKEMLGISDADWKKKWGNLPQDMQGHLFQKADDWINQQADG